MKKLLTVLVVAAMMLSVLSIAASANRGLVYEAPYGTAVIDGVADDADWANATWTNIDLEYADGASSVCSARAKVMHDDTYIYVLAELTDATVAENNGDYLEFYLDEDNCHDADGLLAYCESCYQLRLAVYGDDAMGINGTDQELSDLLIASAVTTSTDGYVMEFQVKPINAPAAGVSMGLEFMYNDQDEEATFLNALRWNADTANGDSAPWQTPENFGTIVFEAAPVVEEAPAEEAAVEDTAAAEEVAEETTAPAAATADAGVVVAVAVMAVAAGVVLSKKH